MIKMTIDEIKNKTREAIKKNSLLDYQEIMQKIKDAADRGEWELYLDYGAYDLEVLKKFKEEGYKVEVYHGDLDDFGNIYEGWVKINWKVNKKSKRNFFLKWK